MKQHEFDDATQLLEAEPVPKNADPNEEDKEKVEIPQEPKEEQKHDTIFALRRLLYSPPVSFTVLVQRLGVNRILADGQERMNTGAFAIQCRRLDPQCTYTESLALARALDSNHRGTIDLVQLHQRLLSRFGSENRSFSSSSSSEPPSALDRIKKKVLRKAGAWGYNGLYASIIQWQNVKKVQIQHQRESLMKNHATKDEIQEIFRHLDVSLNFQELDVLLSLFDSTKCSGKIDVQTMFQTFVGTMRPTRHVLLEQIWHQIIESQEPNVVGQLSQGHVRTLYDASQHPDVLHGKCTPQQHLSAFLGHWPMSVMTWTAFESFYTVRLALSETPADPSPLNQHTQ